MCRSIKTLRSPDHPATEQEINEAALQFVRKVSGYRKPSRSNQAAFEAAVHQVALTTRELLNNLVQPAEAYQLQGKLKIDPQDRNTG
jgi:hypothetical protein